jgi:CHAD domain-containing protein
VQQLEQEVKLEVAPDWVMPNLSGTFPGVTAAPLPDLELETVYFDTVDGRLARHHLALRFRRQVVKTTAGETANGGPEEVWTVKLPSAAPSDGTVLVRTEVNWPIAPPSNATSAGGIASGGIASGGIASGGIASGGIASGGIASGGIASVGRPRPRGGRASARAYPLASYPLEAPAEVAEFLRAVTLGAPLSPVARLVANRGRTELCTSDGRKLAEIDHDRVIGHSLAGGATTNGKPPPARAEAQFEEVEVELAEGSAQEVLDAVVTRLRAAGALLSERTSKLSTLLGALGAGGAAEAGAGAGAADMGEVLAEQARACLEAVVEHDPAVRLGDPDSEHVHRSRVAVRRLRTVLRSLAPLVAGPVEEGDATLSWFADLQADCKWLGGALGAMRDADVRWQGLEEACSELPAADGAGASALLAVADADRQVARRDLLEVMAAERYLHLLRTLEGLAAGAGPGASPVPAELWLSLGGAAGPGTTALARRQWRVLRKSVERLPANPPDAQLHRVRIQAKRLRYLAELAAPLASPPARRRAAKLTAEAASVLQDVLGELHDAAVTEQWLRDSAGRVPTRAGAGRASSTGTAYSTGVAAGQLVAKAQERQRALRKKWAAAWAPLRGAKLHRWVETKR